MTSARGEEPVFRTTCMEQFARCVSKRASGTSKVLRGSTRGRTRATASQAVRRRVAAICPAVQSDTRNDSLQCHLAAPIAAPSKTRRRGRHWNWLTQVARTMRSGSGLYTVAYPKLAFTLWSCGRNPMKSATGLEWHRVTRVLRSGSRPGGKKAAMERAPVNDAHLRSPKN